MDLDEFQLFIAQRPLVRHIAQRLVWGYLPLTQTITAVNRPYSMEPMPSMPSMPSMPLMPLKMTTTRRSFPSTAGACKLAFAWPKMARPHHGRRRRLCAADDAGRWRRAPPAALGGNQAVQPLFRVAARASGSGRCRETHPKQMAAQRKIPRQYGDFPAISRRPFIAYPMMMAFGTVKATGARFHRRCQSGAFKAPHQCPAKLGTAMLTDAPSLISM